LAFDNRHEIPVIFKVGSSRNIGVLYELDEFYHSSHIFISQRIDGLSPEEHLHLPFPQ